MRYLAAQEAVSDWANTAAYCPARFADGTLRSAQARHTARLMAARLAINIAQPTLSRCDDIDSLDIDADSLSAMSVAEDQVGFAMECSPRVPSVMRRLTSAIVIKPLRNA